MNCLNSHDHRRSRAHTRHHAEPACPVKFEEPTSCAPARRTSPTANTTCSLQRGRPTNATSKSRSPGSAPNRSGRPITNTHAAGKVIAEKILDSFPNCPIPEIRRLGKTLTTWRSEYLGYFDTHGSSNGGREAINGLIELHRRIARGFRNLDNYRLRMLLIGGGLNL